MVFQNGELHKLQRIQNTAAHLITGTKQYDHIKPALQKLHWLPVESGIIFKVILITFKILHGLSPAYLSSLLQEYHLPRSLRSSSKSLLTVPTMNSVTYAEGAFSFCAPTLWNTLPHSLKNATSLSSFKSGLKTFPFRNFILGNEKHYIGFYFFTFILYQYRYYHFSIL